MAQIITISGTLGSGKSTVAKMLAEKLGFSYYSTGMAQRKIAAQRGMTTLELNMAAKNDPSIDREIDGVFEKLVEENQNYIVDSRLAFFFIPASFKVMLMASPKVAGERIFKDVSRTGEHCYPDAAAAVEALLKRRALEVERFKRVYGADIEDLTQFNCVIETDQLTPTEICDRILVSFKVFQAHQN